MSRDTVHAILGPPGDYRDWDWRVPWQRWSTRSWGNLKTEPSNWMGNFGTIQVFYDDKNNVHGAAFFEPHGLTPNPRPRPQWLQYLLPQVRE
jgi:hypothetical protein